MVAPRLRGKCLNTLCRMCGQHAVLPKSVQISLCYDRTGAPRYHGGFAEVWKAEHKGREVAVKVLKIYASSNLAKVTKVCSPLSKSVYRPVDVDHAEVLQGSCYMEIPSPSECVTVIGRDDDRQPVDDGFGMDGEREHQ